MSASSTPSLDHLPPTEQLCYVHCNICDTVLAVSVPSTSLFKTVTVRCGHCTSLLPVNMRGLILPSANQFNLGQFFFSSSHSLLVYRWHINLVLSDVTRYILILDQCAMFSLWMNMSQDDIPNPSPNFLINQTTASDLGDQARRVANELPRQPAINRRETIDILLLFFFSHIASVFFSFSFCMIK
ncbi:hypothetical protein K2173_018242 [Erythroxylum novogranatense]|uniref:YABBY N-terminal domain-containing protein n=1 Tax=Erythroxylum novogranatense TaxID=1862640 RepID=A0AAV8TP54_9ROSI|nr:hypothetical protein K2173_018242 [Erythroxylum novogranatense]